MDIEKLAKQFLKRGKRKHKPKKYAYAGYRDRWYPADDYGHGDRRYPQYRQSGLSGLIKTIASAVLSYLNSRSRRSY